MRIPQFLIDRLTADPADALTCHDLSLVPLEREPMRSIMIRTIALCFSHPERCSFLPAAAAGLFFPLPGGTFDLPEREGGLFIDRGVFSECLPPAVSLK